MKADLLITHCPDDMALDDAIMSATDVRDGFIHALTDMPMKTTEWESFKKGLGNIDGGQLFDYGTSSNNIYYKINADKFRAYVRGNSVDLYMSIYCKEEYTCKAVWDLWRDHSEEDEDIVLYMTSFFINGGSLDAANRTIDHKELDFLSDKYYPYINTEVMFDQFFTGAENILLLVGEPGLGKSKMSTLALKHAIHNPDKLPYDKLEDNPALENQFISVAYVKSTDVLISDKFWRELSKGQFDICIIDDLDYMLTKRDAEVMSSDDVNKNQFLNQFLSFTDGVEKNKTKFIITTNQGYDEIDTALLRKGRLFDILELRSLTNEEAMEIWKDNELLEAEFYNIFHEESILPADLGSEINKRKNDRIETATEPYLKEPGISKVQKASRNKKIHL